MKKLKIWLKIAITTIWYFSVQQNGVNFRKENISFTKTWIWAYKCCVY